MPRINATTDNTTPTPRQPQTRNGRTEDGDTYTETYGYRPNGSSFLTEYVLNRVEDGLTERYTYNEAGNLQTITRTNADGEVSFVDCTTETQEERRARERVEFQEYQRRSRANAARRLAEQNRRLREGNHWTIFENPGGVFEFRRDSYSTSTQQEAKKCHVDYLKGEMRGFLADVNRLMDRVGRAKDKIAKVEALEFWPDPNAETYTPPTQETV